MALYDRQITVTVGIRQITGLRMAFKILQSTSPEPNTAEVSIWNLAQASRATMQTEKVETLIVAGYRDNASQIFAGDLRRVTSTNQGADWVTSLKSGDGEVAFREARLNKSFAKGTPTDVVIKDLVLGLKLKAKDAFGKISSGKFREALSTFTSGTVVSGSVPENLTALLRTKGLEWWIEDGQVQIAEIGKPLEGLAYRLAPDSGLIGSPEIGEKGITKIRSLLQPQLRPGRKVKLESRLLNGFYRIEKATHTGDTHGPQWYSELEAKELPTG